MNKVQDQYEAFPYPERDPTDETRRLIEGSPSDPAEVDYYVFGGRRDWSQPFRVLFAGGGTGDGLIMLAQKFLSAGHPVEIVYLDLSSESLSIAKARAEARGLDSISFHQASLLDASDYGEFDYIDCCGVLHHLADPVAGLTALRGVVKDGGGLGGMVYAPYGRRGVYPLQAALQGLFGDLTVSEQLAPARAVLDHLPEGHVFKTNPNLGDHKASDAGFVDLLLHTQDRAYTVAQLCELVTSADFQIVSFLESDLYNPESYLPAQDDIRARAAALDNEARWALAENLNGNMKAHVFYLAVKGRQMKLPSPSDLKLRPRLRGVDAAKLARQISAGGRIRITLGGLQKPVALPKQSAHMIAFCDGRTLGEIASALRLPMLDFIQGWRPVHEALTGANMLRYSDGFE